MTLIVRKLSIGKSISCQLNTIFTRPTKQILAMRKSSYDSLAEISMPMESFLTISVIY